MARRPRVAPRPERPIKSPDEKRQDIARLTRRIEELEAFDPSRVAKRFSSPDVTSIETAIASTLASIFGKGTPEYNSYSRATRLDQGPIQMGGPWSRGSRDEAAEAQGYLAEGKASALVLLRQAVTALEEEIEFAPSTLAAPAEVGIPAAQEVIRKVFIAHGHDEGARETVARFLEKIGFDPIIRNDGVRCSSHLSGASPFSRESRSFLPESLPQAW